MHKEFNIHTISLKSSIPIDYFTKSATKEHIDLIKKCLSANTVKVNINKIKEIYINILVYVLILKQNIINNLFNEPIFDLYKLFQESYLYLQITNSSFTPEFEEDIAHRIKIAISGNEKFVDTRYLLLCMLLKPAHTCIINIDHRTLPPWIWNQFFIYIFRPPAIMLAKDEITQYHNHLFLWLSKIKNLLNKKNKDASVYKISQFAVFNLNLIPLYLHSDSTLALYRLRAHIIENLLIINGNTIDFKFNNKSNFSGKIKIGFLNAHFGPQTETHVTMSTMRLNRDKFEIHLFCNTDADTTITQNECKKLSQSFTILDGDIKSQVKSIRAKELDIIIIGTNITAVTNTIALLSAHKLAKCQIVSYCSPVSTGFRNIDYFITGSRLRCNDIDSHFSEKLLYCTGTPGCLDYTVENSTKLIAINKLQLNIPENEILFVNSASCYKISRSALETWAIILQRCPNSRLILFPYNPNWSNKSPKGQFEDIVTNIFNSYGVSHERIIFFPPLKSRNELKSIQTAGDIYLDTFPFSGSISVIDPLELGLPTITLEGDAHRSRMASSLLRELNIDELVAPDIFSYINLAIKLANDLDLRLSLKKRILEAINLKPIFINPELYGDQLGLALLNNIKI